MKNVKLATIVGSFLSFFLCVALAAVPAAGQAPADNKRLDEPAAVPGPAPANKPATAPSVTLTKEDLLTKADSAYYFLQNLGLKSFRCTVQPNWAQIIPDQGQLALLREVQYSAVIDEHGNSTVTALRTDDAAIDPSVSQIVGGVKETIEGFFQSWNNMVFLPLFSPDSDSSYVFSTDSTGYHLAQNASDSNSVMTMTRDALITAIKVVTGDSTITMQPKYSKTDHGLLLIGLDSHIASSGGSQVVNFQIQYQLIGGFELPEKVGYQVTLPTQTVSIDINLGDYKIVTR
jgi:hypothetical protein